MSGLQVGDTIRYRYLFRNQDRTLFNDLAVSDNHNGYGLLVPDGPQMIEELRRRQSGEIRVLYTVLQSDIDRCGTLSNVATATGIAYGPFDWPTAEQNVPLAACHPNATLTKSHTFIVDNGEVEKADAGDVVQYSYNVINTGNTTITDVAITDSTSGSGSVSAVSPANVANLPPGESVQFTSTYIVVQDDVDRGLPISNTAIMNTTTNLDPKSDIEFVGVASPGPSLSITKSFEILGDTTNPGTLDVGEIVEYTYIVSNNGNVSVTNLQVSDHVNTGALVAVTPPQIASLSPGESATFEGSYTFTQSDFDSALSQLSNVAFAHAIPVNGTLTPVSDSVSIPISDAMPGFDFSKSIEWVLDSNTNNTLDVGDIVRYIYIVSNTGNTTFTEISILDLHDGLGTAPVISPSEYINVMPGESRTFSALYTATQGDIDRGGFVANTASPVVLSEGLVIPATDMVVVPVTNAAPAASLTKVPEINPDGGTPGVGDVGDTIQYTFVVTNIGNVSIDDVSVIDAHGGFSSATPITPPSHSDLAPGQQRSFSSSYVVTQEDLDNLSSIQNTATISATGVVIPPIVTVNVPLADRLLLVNFSKEWTISPDGRLPSIADEGDQVVYTYTITNGGTVSIRDINLTDIHNGNGNLTVMNDGCAPPTVVPPGGSCVVTASYTVTNQDVLDQADIANTATATGASSIGAFSHTASASIPIGAIPKTCVDFPAACGEQDDGAGGLTTYCTAGCQGYSVTQPNPVESCYNTDGSSKCLTSDTLCQAPGFSVCREPQGNGHGCTIKWVLTVPGNPACLSTPPAHGWQYPTWPDPSDDQKRTFYCHPSTQSIPGCGP